MKNINWDTEKSLALVESRGICFEDVVFHIEKGDILDDYQHPNQQKYAGQRIRSSALTTTRISSLMLRIRMNCS